MTKRKGMTKTRIAAAIQGFALAGFPPHRAILRDESTTIFFNPDLPDDIFESDDPDAALRKWEAENEQE